VNSHILNQTLRTNYRRWGKRFLDIVISGVALFVLWPVLVLVSLIIKLDSPGPVLFVQKRVGLNGRVFNIYKFRTMTHRHRLPTGEIFGRDREVTRAGYWLRRFKIDELPQLINVLKGDMSIVGPRPGLPSQLLEYDENGKKRLLVRPGLTGLAQINGNIYLPWPKRWQYDALYVDNLSPCLDFKIMFWTILVVIKGEKHFYRRLVEEKNDHLIN